MVTFIEGLHLLSRDFSAYPQLVLFLYNGHMKILFYLKLALREGRAIVLTLMVPTINLSN